jgi:hypothetical protein
MSSSTWKTNSTNVFTRGLATAQEKITTTSLKTSNLISTPPRTPFVSEIYWVRCKLRIPCRFAVQSYIQRLFHVGPTQLHQLCKNRENDRRQDNRSARRFQFHKQNRNGVGLRCLSFLDPEQRNGQEASGFELQRKSTLLDPFEFAAVLIRRRLVRFWRSHRLAVLQRRLQLPVSQVKKL